MKAEQRPVVVLIPGLGNNERLWAAQQAVLADACVSMVPHYGGGKSIHEMASKVLAQTPTGPLSLVGFSLGAYIAFEIIRQQPERIRHLALISASPFADDEDAKQQRRRLMEKAAADYGPLLADMGKFIVFPDGPNAAATRRTLIRMGEELGAEEFCRQQQAAIDRRDCCDLLAGIRCPTRVLCGREDPITPVAGNRYVAEHIPGATLTIVKGAGHLLPLERPDEVNQFLLNWLSDTALEGTAES